MDLEEPDVVVVGLGPAGARAAAALATAGLEVLAIDRRRRAGVPVQCAEFVPMMIARDVEGVGATTTQLIRRMLTIVDQGEPEETPNCPGRIIDRAGSTGCSRRRRRRRAQHAALPRRCGASRPMGLSSCRMVRPAGRGW
jgi:choline dehydrogenase-like flavoprotein